MKTIIFDMYGVIIKESKGNFIPYTLEHFPNTDIEYLKTQFTRAGNGEINTEAFMTSLGFTDWQKHMADYLLHHLSFDTGFIALAEKAKRSFNLALLSNDVAEWSEFVTETYGLNGYFRHTVISGNVGYRKPEPRIYELMLTKLGCPAADCLFVDNSVKNLRTAQRMGMDTILFNRDNKTYEGKTVYSFTELEQMLLINV